MPSIARVLKDEDGAAEAQLGHLQVLTDTAISNLAVDELLDELLGRVQEVLDVDTAAVLLVDKSGTELVATAARGIEEEVREGVRVPIGSGFSGRVAATRGPIRLDRVDATTVANPILWEKGIAGDARCPAACRRSASRRAPRRAAWRTGRSAITTLRCSKSSPTVSRARPKAGLSRSNAPPPRCWNAVFSPISFRRFPGLELAARYVPATGEAVGGDWYDVFTLPSGQLWIVVGDVAGHGIAASDRDGTHPQCAARLLAARPSRRRGLTPRRPQGRPLRDRDHRHGRLRGHLASLRHHDRRAGRASTAGGLQPRTSRPRSLPFVPVRRSVPDGPTTTHTRRRHRARLPAPPSPSTPTASSSDAMKGSTKASSASAPRCHPRTPVQMTATSCTDSSAQPRTNDDIALVVLRRTAT